MTDAMKELEGHCDCYPDELCEWCQVRVDWFNRGKNNALDAVMEWAKEEKSIASGDVVIYFHELRHKLEQLKKGGE